MIIRKRILGLMLATASVLAAGSAMAADYEPPVFEAPALEEQYVPVEVGSGWYLRGDVSYIFNEPYRDRFSSATPPLATFDEKFTPANFGIGMGYHFNDYLRAELNLATMPKYKASFSQMLDVGGPTEAYLEGATESYGYYGMVSGFFDLGTFVGITPYVGGGLGLAYHKTTATSSVDYTDNMVNIDEAAAYQDRAYSLAYSLGAGLQYKVSKNVALDFGYQYFSAPEAKHAVLTDGGYEIDKGIDYHQVKVGLRYDLW